MRTNHRLLDVAFFGKTNRYLAGHQFPEPVALFGLVRLPVCVDLPPSDFRLFSEVEIYRADGCFDEGHIFGVPAVAGTPPRIKTYLPALVYVSGQGTVLLTMGYSLTGSQEFGGEIAIPFKPAAIKLPAGDFEVATGVALPLRYPALAIADETPRKALAALHQEIKARGAGMFYQISSDERQLDRFFREMLATYARLNL